MAEVVATIRAFDKDSSNFFGKTIVAETKEEFNEQVEDFEEEVPFSRFYITIEAEDYDLTPEQLQIVEDHELD